MIEQKRSKLGDRIGQFVAVPVAFINDATVSARAFRLFVVLRSYTSTNNADDMVFPGYETLRAKCGFSNFRYIAEAIRELEAKPVVSQTWDNLKRLMTTEYSRAHKQDSSSARATGFASAHNVVEELAEATEEIIANLTEKHAQRIEALVK